MSTTARAPRSTVLAVLLTAAIVLNLAQFRAVDARAAPHFAALQRGDTSDLVQLAYHECPWCQDRYSLHFALAVVAPGSRVIVDPAVPQDLPGPFGDYHNNSEELAVRLLTFGRAGQVGWLAAEQAAVLIGGVDPAPFVIATGEGGVMGLPWTLAVDPSRLPPPGTAEPADFLPQALAGGAHRASSHPPGEFLLLRWPGPTGSEYSYQDLLLETSLLPDELRENL